MIEKKKFISCVISLYAVTLLFWVIWFMRAFAWVSYKEVTVKILGSVLIALATIMFASAYVMFRLARPSYMLAGRKKRMFIAMGSILIVMLVNIGLLHQYEQYGYTISSYAIIEHKESEGGNYYFQIKDSESGSTITFSCEKEKYGLLKTNGTRYFIQYRKLTFGKEKATLGYIDVRKENKK